MILVEQSPVPTAVLPVEAFREHLLLGTGFADDTSQDALLESLLRSALAAIEARISKAILRRGFLWQLTAWRGVRREDLPIAPVSGIQALRIIEPSGEATVIAADRYRLEPDTHRPALVARGLGLPTVPVGGGIEIEFEAGFAADWAGVPNDLKQAVFLLAAEYYEHRQGAGLGTIPPHVAQLTAPYRPMRLFGRRS